VIKLVLLTTDTTHHLFYAWMLSGRFPIAATFLETRQLKPRFETAHPFELERDAYEREVLLAGCRSSFRDLGSTHVVESMNDHTSLRDLLACEPDVVIVFGTGRLKGGLATIARTACLNLHGGNPEQYRGLDTHLWAIYHDDFANLVTTLHHLDEDLDTGDIVMQSQLPIASSTRLHELRSVNTRVCVELSLAALGALDATGRMPRRKQVTRGRYYSFMPTALKQECVRRFERRIGAV
jgi:methionyl-tRNA formyltransferase